MSTLEDIQQTVLRQNMRTDSKGPQSSISSFLSASGVSISTDFLESSVQDPSGNGFHKKSGNSNRASEAAKSWSSMPDLAGAGPHKKSAELLESLDFLESSVQDPSGNGFHKKSGNSNRASEAAKSWSSMPDLAGAGPHKKSAELLESLDLASRQRFLGFPDSPASFTLDVPRLFVYDDEAGYSDSNYDVLEISKISSNSITDKLQEERLEVCSMHSDYSYASSSTFSYSSENSSSSVALYNNGINSQKTNVRIRKVTHLNQQQFITNDGTDLLKHTDNVMEDVKCYFDISHTKAWKNVLDTDKIVFLVGFSESLKKLISLKFYQKYKAARVDVFRVNGPEDMKICYKRSKPYAIFMEDAFGPFGTEFESIFRVIKDLSAFKNLQAALFMMDPLSFERNKESLKKCIKRRLADHVVHLEEEEHLLSEDEKREILEKSSELVREIGRSLTKHDIDEIVCFENPIFVDTCEEFVVYNRHDKNVCNFFSLPLDCLVDVIKYLKEKWLDGYYVLRLVAFHEVFDQSEMGREIAKYLRQSIHGNVPQILNQMVGSYLEIQHNKAGNSQANISALKFAFRHRMMQYAVLCTETDKAFLIEHCPIGFLVDVIAQMTNMREISFENEKRSIAKRFIHEILTGKHVSTVVIHEIWNSEEFLEDFKQEWETVKTESIVSTSACKSNFLYLAVFNKSPKLLDWILKTIKEEKIKCSTLSYWKAIFATCIKGHFEHFKLLMEQIKDVDRFCQPGFEHILIPKRNTINSIIDFDETKCYSHATHTAIAFNRLDILNYLKRCGQNVNYTDSQGHTSLHVACRCGSDLEILEYLKENNGDIANVTDKSRNTCLHEACCRYDNIRIVTWLVNNFPNLVLKRNTAGQIPLQIAVEAGNIQIVELLIAISKKFKKNPLLRKDASGCTVLHMACEVDNNLQMVQFFLKRQPSLINIEDHDGNTVLHVACRYDNIEIVTWLVKDFPNSVLKRNTAGQTPLHIAVEGGNMKIVELLIEISNKLQENCLLEIDSSGCTVLHMACDDDGNLQMVKFLLKRQPSLINIKDHDGDTALHVASVFGSIEIVTWLVKKFPNLVLERNTAGRTPLYRAVEGGETQIVKLLIKISKEIKKKLLLNNDSNKFQENCLLEKDSSGWTVLHLACFKENLKIVKFLVERQPSLIIIKDEDGDIALHYACFFANIEIVTLLVKDFPRVVLKVNKAGETPLHIAAQSGNTHIVKFLIKISNQFQENCLLKRDSSGCTVLHLACKIRPNLQIVKLLLERQPYLITIQDCHGDTAFHYACQRTGNTEVIEFLVSKGMDINKVNIFLRTPLHTACMADNLKVVRFLLAKENIQITMDKDNKYPYQLTKSKSVRDKFAQMGYHE